VPAQQSVRGDEPAFTLGTREHSGDGGEQRPVAVGELGRLGRSLQHCELVTKHDDLEVLRSSRTDGEQDKRSEHTVEQAEHPADSGAENPQVNGHDRENGTLTASPRLRDRTQAPVRTVRSIVMSTRLPRWTSLLVLPMLVGALLLMHGLDAHAGDTNPVSASTAESVVEHPHDESTPAEHGHCPDCLAGHVMAACVAIITAIGGLGLVRRLLARSSLAIPATAVAGRIRGLVELARRSTQPGSGCRSCAVEAPFHLHHRRALARRDIRFC
jgi:hypothetical protein